MSRRKSFESSGCVQIEGEEDGYDALTGLPDRTSLERRIEQRLAQKGRPFSLIAVDIDNFRSYNDAYGYAVGDAIIARFGRYLQASLSSGAAWAARSTWSSSTAPTGTSWTASRAICSPCA